jgi:hypothetical protein
VTRAGDRPVAPATVDSRPALSATIVAEGYAFVHAATMRDLLERTGPLADWPSFAASWDALELDEYMADGGRYRRRRHAVYTAAGAAIERQPHQPHYQALAYNPLHGGVERWFEPIAPDVGAGDSLLTILEFCRSLFGGLTPAVEEWRIEVHQFRIEARPGEQGRPTPEGLHRDGVAYALVLLITRHNIARGVTAIHALDGVALGHFTLAEPMDAAIVDDARVAHGVTPVEAVVADEPAYRDVLVVTFIDAGRAAPAPKPSGA